MKFLFFILAFNMFYWTAKAVAEDYTVDLIAAVLIGEAGGEGSKGMEAIAEVIRNRQELTGKSLLQTVKKPRQFSCLNRQRPKQLIQHAQHHSEWDNAVGISRLLYLHPGDLPNITHGATHFENVKINGYPLWAHAYKPIAEIGNHMFWRIEK